MVHRMFTAGVQRPGLAPRYSVRCHGGPQTSGHAQPNTATRQSDIHGWRHGLAVRFVARACSWSGLAEHCLDGNMLTHTQTLQAQRVLVGLVSEHLLQSVQHRGGGADGSSLDCLSAQAVALLPSRLLLLWCVSSTSGCIDVTIHQDRASNDCLAVCSERIDADPAVGAPTLGAVA